MAETEPTFGQLWEMIERDLRLTRENLQESMKDVKERLNTFVTKEVFESEKRLLEARIMQAEYRLSTQEALHIALKEKLERDEGEAVTNRQRDRREFVYKGIIPALSLLIAGIALYISR